MTLEIRSATPADAEAIQAVARDSWHAAYDDFLGAETVETTIDSWYVVDDLERSITAADQHLFVADGGERGETPAGIVGFVHVAPSSDGPDVAHLARIYVRSERWGEGIGRRLLARAETALEADGFERLRLEVFAENEVGVRFYEATGFERVDEQNEAFAGEHHTVITFEKVL